MLVHIKRYSINEVEKLLKEKNLIWDGYKAHEETIELNGYKVYTHSMRYKNFFTHGYKRVTCGKEGTHFYLDVDPNQSTTRAHFNLYAEDDTLLTKDHIFPKSLGGSNHDINNFQTMCTFCNNQKGNTIPPDISNIGMFDIIPPTKKVKGKGKKIKVVNKFKPPMDDDGNVIHAKNVMKCTENDDIIICYGKFQFNSIQAAINFARTNIQKNKKVLPQSELECINKKIKHKINSALYQGKKFGESQWSVKIKNI